MRLRYKAKTFLQFIAFAFYPKVTILVCLATAIILDIILGIILYSVNPDTPSYDILLALMTGATASFIVAIIVELANNYRHNKLAWHELGNYYSTVNNYEIHKQILMQHSPHQSAEKKARKEAGIYVDEFDRPRDIIEATWKYLPEIMPVFKDTLENKKQFLTDREILELEIATSAFKTIRGEIHMLLTMTPILYNALNHPDEQYPDYPQNILNDMPEWMRKNISSVESEKAIERLADEILSDFFLMEQFMERYDISQSGINNYKNPYDEDEYEAEDESYTENTHDCEDYDFSEPEDEEEFKALHDEQDRILVEENIPFVSWHISTECKNISESIDILEKEILKKPYYSIRLRYEREMEKESV